MVPSKNTVNLDRRLPDSQLVLYPDAGHGGVFQFHEDFVQRALEFLLKAPAPPHTPRADARPPRRRRSLRAYGRRSAGARRAPPADRSEADEPECQFMMQPK